MSIAYPHFAPSNFQPVFVAENGQTFSQEQLSEGADRAEAEGNPDRALRFRLEAAKLVVLRTWNIETAKADILVMSIPIGLFWALLLAGRWVFQGFHS